MFERLFHLKENRTTPRIELTAGLTTFMSMAYIIFVNPNILQDAGIPFEGALFATCVSSAVACFLMGLLTNYPIALAPGMGINAYFTYTVCIGMGVPWQVALGAVFLSGIIFILLTVFHIWTYIVDAIPETIKFSIAAGIGIFLAFIGLQNAGIVVHDDSTMVRLGNLFSASAGLTFFGFILTAILMARAIKGAILIGILCTTALAVIVGHAPLPDNIISFPDFSFTFLQLDIAGAFSLGFFTIVFVFLFVDIFDTVGTLLGVGEQGGFLREGKLPRTQRAMLADAIGTVTGACTGTSTVTSYIESASGIAEGGKSGLTSVIVGFLFLASLFFSPIAGIIPSAATAPALIVVGSLMARVILKIKWDDITESLPAFLVIIAIPLTYNIANGIALGFLVYPFIKALSGKAREVSLLVWILAAFFIIRYLFYFSN